MTRVPDRAGAESRNSSGGPVGEIGGNVLRLQVCGPGMMTAAQTPTGVLEEGGVPVSAPRAARLPFKRAAGEENFGPEGPFQAKMPQKALVRRFHKSRDSAFACAHSALVGCSACGLLLPPLPRPCCWHASGHAAVRFARKTAARLLERACAMPSLCDHDTLAVFARRVLHVSAGRQCRTPPRSGGLW